MFCCCVSTNMSCWSALKHPYFIFIFFNEKHQTSSLLLPDATQAEKKIHHGRSFFKITALIRKMADWEWDRMSWWGRGAEDRYSEIMIWVMEERKEKVRGDNTVKRDERGMRFLFLSSAFITRTEFILVGSSSCSLNGSFFVSLLSCRIFPHRCKSIHAFHSFQVA